MESGEDTLPRHPGPRQPRLLPRAGRVPSWARGRSPLRSGRGHRRIPVPVQRRPGPGGCGPEGFWAVQERPVAPGVQGTSGGGVGYGGYHNGAEWNRSFVEGQASGPSSGQGGGQRRAEGPVRGHSVPDPYHGASSGEGEDGWEDVLPPVSSSYSLPELPNLSEEERKCIMEVIRRDEHLRRQDDLRVMRLKAELQFLRRKGALRADWDPNSGAQSGGGGSPGPGVGGGGGGGGVGVGLVGGLGSGLIGGGGGGGNGGGRACARCRAELGRIINRGAFCRACRLRVCKACREYNVRATDWVCSVCHKHMEIQVATGEWMNEFVRRPSRRRDNRVYVPAADIVKRSIRRSWTISTSHRRSFGGPQGSPELRAYSSLPRGASYLPAAAAEAAADAADAAADARRSTDNRESPPHRRLPPHPLLYLLRRGSSGGSSSSGGGGGGGGGAAADVLPTRRCVSQDDDVIPPMHPPLSRRDEDSIFSSEKLVDGSTTSNTTASANTSPGRRPLGRKGVSLKRQQAVSTGSAGSTGEVSSEGESLPPKSPRDRKGSGTRFAKALEKIERPEEGGRGKVGRAESLERKVSKEKEAATGEEQRHQQQPRQQEEDEEEDEDPVEDFDVEPLSGTIFRKVTIKKKKKKSVDEEEIAVGVEGDDSGGLGTGDAGGQTTPSSASSTVAPSPSLLRSEKQLLLHHHQGELSRRLGVSQDPSTAPPSSYEGGGGSPAHAALLLDYVLDEGKIQPDGEDYKLVFISSDSSSKASTTNSDEEAAAEEEDCDWDYFEPARPAVGEEEGSGVMMVVGGVHHSPPPPLSSSAPASASSLQLQPTPPMSVAPDSRLLAPLHSPAPSPPLPSNPSSHPPSSTLTEVSKLPPAAQSRIAAVEAAAAVAADPSSPPPQPQHQHRVHHHKQRRFLQKSVTEAGERVGEEVGEGEEVEEQEKGGVGGEGEGGGGREVVSLTDHIFFVEPMPATVGFEAAEHHHHHNQGVEGGQLASPAAASSSSSRRGRRRRARRVGRSRSETDLARLHLRLASSSPEEARFLGERSGSEGFVIGDGPATILAAGDFGPAGTGLGTTGIRMWTLEREGDDRGSREGGGRTIIPVPVPVPVPAWPSPHHQRFTLHDKADEIEIGLEGQALPRGPSALGGDAVSVADIVYLGPSGSNAVRIRIRSFQRSSPSSLNDPSLHQQSSVSHVSVVGPAAPSPSSWYAWHRVLDSPAAHHHSAAYTSSVTLSTNSRLHDPAPRSSDGDSGGSGFPADSDLSEVEGEARVRAAAAAAVEDEEEDSVNGESPVRPSVEVAAEKGEERSGTVDGCEHPREPVDRFERSNSCEIDFAESNDTSAPLLLAGAGGVKGERLISASEPPKCESVTGSGSPEGEEGGGVCGEGVNEGREEGVGEGSPGEGEVPRIEDEEEAGNNNNNNIGTLEKGDENNDTTGGGVGDFISVEVAERSVSEDRAEEIGREGKEGVACTPPCGEGTVPEERKDETEGGEEVESEESRGTPVEEEGDDASRKKEKEEEEEEGEGEAGGVGGRGEGEEGKGGGGGESGGEEEKERAGEMGEGRDDSGDEKEKKEKEEEGNEAEDVEEKSISSGRESPREVVEKGFSGSGEAEETDNAIRAQELGGAGTLMDPAEARGISEDGGESEESREKISKAKEEICEQEISEEGKKAEGTSGSPEREEDADVELDAKEAAAIGTEEREGVGGVGGELDNDEEEEEAVKYVGQTGGDMTKQADEGVPAIRSTNSDEEATARGVQKTDPEPLAFESEAGDEEGFHVAKPKEEGTMKKNEGEEGIPELSKNIESEGIMIEEEEGDAKRKETESKTIEIESNDDQSASKESKLEEERKEECMEFAQKSKTEEEPLQEKKESPTKTSELAETQRKLSLDESIEGGGGEDDKNKTESDGKGRKEVKEGRDSREEKGEEKETAEEGVEEGNTVILLSYRPLNESSEAAKVYAKGESEGFCGGDSVAWVDDCRRPRALSSHSPGAREGEAVGLQGEVLSTVGGVVVSSEEEEEAEEGKEVVSPRRSPEHRPFAAQPVSAAAAEEKEAGRGEGPLLSSGTLLLLHHGGSVLNETREGKEHSGVGGGERPAFKEEEEKPPPALSEAAESGGGVRGRKGRGKRKRNRRRKRRRGGKQRGDEPGNSAGKEEEEGTSFAERGGDQDGGGPRGAVAAVVSSADAMGDGRPVGQQEEEEGVGEVVVPGKKPPPPGGEASEGEDSVAAQDSDDGETSSGEFDLASGPMWGASIMTPPSVSSNSDAAGNSEESDSDDENFSRVFVVNAVEDEEDEGVGRGEEDDEEEEEEEEGEVVEGNKVPGGGAEDPSGVKKVVVKLEGAALPYGGAGVRLMHIRSLTDEDYVVSDRCKAPGGMVLVQGAALVEAPLSEQDDLRASSSVSPLVDSDYSDRERGEAECVCKKAGEGELLKENDKEGKEEVVEEKFIVREAHVPKSAPPSANGARKDEPDPESFSVSENVFPPRRKTKSPDEGEWRGESPVPPQRRDRGRVIDKQDQVDSDASLGQRSRGEERSDKPTGEGEEEKGGVAVGNNKGGEEEGSSGIGAGTEDVAALGEPPLGQVAGAAESEREGVAGAGVVDETDELGAHAVGESRCGGGPATAVGGGEGDGVVALDTEGEDVATSGGGGEEVEEGDVEATAFSLPAGESRDGGNLGESAPSGDGVGVPGGVGGGRGGGGAGDACGGGGAVGIPGGVGSASGEKCISVPSGSDVSGQDAGVDDVGGVDCGGGAFVIGSSVKEASGKGVEDEEIVLNELGVSEKEKKVPVVEEVAEYRESAVAATSAAAEHPALSRGGAADLNVDRGGCGDDGSFHDISCDNLPAEEVGENVEEELGRREDGEGSGDVRPQVLSSKGMGETGDEGGGTCLENNMLHEPLLSGGGDKNTWGAEKAEEEWAAQVAGENPQTAGVAQGQVVKNSLDDTEGEQEEKPLAAFSGAEEDRISPQFHAKATAEQVSSWPHDSQSGGEEGASEGEERKTEKREGEGEEKGEEGPHSTEEEASGEKEEANEIGVATPALGIILGKRYDGVVDSACGSEMALAIAVAEVVEEGSVGGEGGGEEEGGGPEEAFGEERSDPVPAGGIADPTTTAAAATTPASSTSSTPSLSPLPPTSPPPRRRSSLPPPPPPTPSPPGERAPEVGRDSVDAWKAPSEDGYFKGRSLRWRTVGGRDAGEGRCVSLEDILHPEARSFASGNLGSASESAITSTTTGAGAGGGGGGGGVYTSYVMITQDGGVGEGLSGGDSGGLSHDLEEVEDAEGTEEGVLSERSGSDEGGRHQRVNVSVVEVSVVTSETTTLVSEEEEEDERDEEEMDEEDDDGEEGETSSDEGGVVLKHVNWGEEEEKNKNNTGLAGYFTLTLETGTASPTPPRRPEIKSSKTIQLKDPSGMGNGLVDLPICGGDLSGGESSGDNDEGRNGGMDAVRVVTGGDTLSAVVCLEEGLADDDSWVEEIDAPMDDIRDDDDELGSESASSGDEAYFDREEELRGYNRAIDFTLHTILEESGEESEAENHQNFSQSNNQQVSQSGKNRLNVSNAEADASELEKYYFFDLGGMKGTNQQEEGVDDQKYANEESEISDTVSETSCSSIYSEGLESLGIVGAPGQDGISESAEGILGIDPAELASSRLEKYFMTNILGLEPPRGLRAPLGDEDAFSENTDESGSVGSDSEGRPSPEQRRKRLVRARGAGRQHHNSGGSGGGAASDAEAATGSPSGTASEGTYPQQSSHTHSQAHHHQQQQKLLGQSQQQQSNQQQQQQQNSGGQQDQGDGEGSSTGSDSFDETAFEKNDGQFDTVKRKKKKRKENRHQEGEVKEECIALSGEDHDGAKTPQPDLATVAEEEEDGGEAREGRGERERDEAAALDAENSLGPGGQAGRKQASRDSGFIGSCDDLLKDQQQQRISDGEQRSSGSDKDTKKTILRDYNSKEEMKLSIEDAIVNKNERATQVPKEEDVKPALDVIGEAEVAPLPTPRPVPSGSPASITRTSLSRKDSFNNWSSDEETNLMMSKMRAFFKTMVAGKSASVNSSGLRRSLSNSSRQSNGGDANSASSSTNGDINEPTEKVKPPQLVYFENELTRLMKTVPGIRDEQVKEIVEYLSSEDTWSDSYDSSDYTSSDLEGAGMGYHARGPAGPLRTELQQQISASCQQIIRNFDNSAVDDVEDDEGFGRSKNSVAPTSEAMNRETAFVYQRLVASFGKVAGGVGEPSSSDASSTPHSSPPLIAKVMHHIGGRLVALMHEVSAAGTGEGPHASNSSPSFSRNLPTAGSPKTGNNQVAAAMAARYRRLLRREAAAAAKDDKGSVTSTSVESECPSTDTEERSVDSDADSSSSSPPPMSRLPSLPRSKSHDLGQWQRLLLTGEGNRRVGEAHSYYYGVSGAGSSSMGGAVGSSGAMVSSGVHPGGVGGRDNKESLRSSSSGVSDLAEEREEYERLSWRGSFESALAADSRTKLSTEAKRRSAGSGSGSASDLCSSNDQLDHRGRVRSCGSITSAGSRGSLLQQQQLGARARLSASGGDLLAYRSSASRGTVAEEHEGEGDDEGDGDASGSTGALSRRRRSVPDARGPPGERSTTLPRSNTAVSASTNSLPRLPTVSAPPHGTAAAAIHKSQSLMGHHMQQAHQQQQQSHHHHHHHHHLFLQNVKSARYRPPGFRPPPVPPVPPKRAVSVPGLNHQNRGRGERRRQSSGDDTVSASETTGKGLGTAVGSTTPTAGSAPPTPGGGKKVSTGSSLGSWPNSPPMSPSAAANSAADDEPTNERVPNTHQQTTTLSSLGLRSDSMASVYSGAGEGRYGTVAVRGEVEFALQYNYKQGALEILVKQCRELAPVDTKRNRSDPYVKVYLLPDKSKSGKRKTKVKKHTLNPVFDETLKFHITLNGLETRTLWLTVWHSDMFGRNDFLGEVMMSLENKVFDDPSPKWYPLQERTEPFDDLLCYKGEMIVGLKFVPPDVTHLHKKGRMSKGSLHVLVKDAKNLTAVKANGTSDPFCKSYLLPDKGRSSKQKTAVCRKSINPVWNHTFVYDDVSLQELSERSLELTVWDHDRLASNEFLGGLRFNLGTGRHYGKNVDWMDATGREMTLWQNMLERANFWVEGCLTLRPTLDHRASPSSTLAS